MEKYNFTSQTTIIHEPEIANSERPVFPPKNLASFKLKIFEQT